MVIVHIDEFYFHVKRGLPKWERIGHPLDTLSVLVCFLFVLFVPYSSFNLKVYIALALFSCIFVTKDEFVHKECCPASEQWLHAFLFLNHPIVLTVAGLLWPLVQDSLSPAWLIPFVPNCEWITFGLRVQTSCIFLFMLYQIVYWNLIRKKNGANESCQ